MDPQVSPKLPESGTWIFQYFFILFTILVPTIWKLYTSSPAFRYQAKMTLYICWVFLTSFLIIPMALRDPRNPDNTRTVGRWLFIDFLRVKNLFGIRVIKRQLENFRKAGDGPYIVVSNHQSSLDLIPMFDAVPERCTALGKKELLYAGPFGLAAWLCGGIFVDRRPGKARGTMDETVDELKQKNMRLWIFPEGTRNHGGGLLPFKKGAFHIAVQAQIPIVPVVVSSYSNFYQKKTNKFESGSMIVTVLPPVPTTSYAQESISELVEKTRNQMVDVFESTSKEIDPNFKRRSPVEDLKE